MKKKIFIFSLILIYLSLFFSFSTKAQTYDDTKNVSYSVTTHEETNLSGDVLHINDWGNTTKANKDYSQQVNVLTMKTNENAKVVTWAISNGSGFERNTVANIARDYEKNHPGWKVVGGINADQYYQKYGTALGTDGSDYFYPQPYYPMIADYEKWFAITATPYGNGHIVGFTNDGSEDQLLYYNAGWNYNQNAADKAKIKGLFITIYTDNNTTIKFPIENVNKAPNSGESSLYSPYHEAQKVPDLNVSGTNLFVVENAELAYMSNSETFTYKANNKNNQNAFFGKGEITAKTTAYTLKEGQFAIDTTNQELLNALSIGKKVVVQYEFEGPLNEVEAGIGFHFIMRKDNVDQPMTGSYNTQLYPRSMFGRKADGTIVFCTVDGRQASAGMNGVDVQEANAILKHYGVVEGYQLDGGGSVTMIVRQGNSFKTVNSPSDGSDRYVLSALFFVVKVPNIDQTIEVYQDKLSFTVINSEPDIEKIYVKLDNVQKEVVNGKVEFTNLLPNKEYSYQYLYEKNGKLETSVLIDSVFTAKRVPSIKWLKIVSGEGEVEIRVDINDPDNTIIQKSLSLDGEKKYLNKDYLTFDKADFKYENLAINLTYDLNDGTGSKNLKITTFTIYSDLTVYMENIINILKEKVKVYE